MSYRRVQQFFDEHAAGWDEAALAQSHERLVEMTAHWQIKPGSRVLDVGTGTGVLFDLLSRKIGTGGLLAAVDVSFKMLEIANRKKTGCRIGCVQADVIRSPFSPSYFDWAICYSVFPHFDDQREALCVLASRLRPGGRLVIAHSSSRQTINEFHRKVGDVVGGDFIPEATTMRMLIRRAGLTLERFADLPDRYEVIASRQT